jgi:protein ImuB
MALAQARALFECGGVRVEASDGGGDWAALGRVAVWAQRFSPVVAVDDAEAEPGGLMLDVTGCAAVWGGEARLVRAVVDGFAGLGLSAQVAVAPTLGCAWGVSRFGEGPGEIVQDGGARRALEGLPVGALRIGSEVVERLGEVGIVRVGQVLEMPRSALAVRFGGGLLLRVDQALGQAIETIEPVRPVAAVVAERVFDGPTRRAEAIEGAVRELLDELEAELERRGAGARRVRVELVRSDLEPEVVSVTLGRPVRAAARLWGLIRPKLERAHLGFGVEAVRVGAPVVGRVRHEQVECVGVAGGVAGGVSGAEGERALGELLDTLGNRLGGARVLRAGLRESHVPERRFVMVGVEGAVGMDGCGWCGADRPTVVFERPEEAEVIALTPDGPVHRVVWRGRVRAVTACVGPERIGCEWWRGALSRVERTRDYFAVRDERGEWLWVGRGVESGRWFVHGVWA